MSEMSSQSDNNDSKPLKMLCRRGLKELDLVLKTYLEKYSHSASIEEINALKSLLKMDDHSLLSFIIKPPQDASTVLLSLYKKLQNLD